MKFKAISKWAYQRHKRQYRPFIWAALSYGSNETLRSIEAKIASREALVVLILQRETLTALMVLEKTGAIMQGVTISGDLPKGWVHDALKKFRLLGACNGCTHLELKGRKGWARLLKPLGFEPVDNDFLRVAL